MCFFFGDALRRDSAPRNLNRGRKRKRWGRGRGEKAVRKIAGGFSHCLLPSLSPPCRFLFPPRFSFCAAVTLTFRTTKEKNTLKNLQLRKLRGARVREGGAESKRNTETVAHLWKIAFSLLPFPRLPSPTSIFASPSPLSLIFALFSVWSEKIERL